MGLRKTLVNIASVNLIRRAYYAVTDKYSDATCKQAFVEAMNRKSEAIGLTHSHWINPSGLGEDGRYSQSTARDLALLGVAAWSYVQLREMWTKKIHEMSVTKSYVWHPKKHVKRRVGSTIEMSELGEFPILGGKTGAGDDYYTLLIISEVGDSNGEGYLAGAIMQAESLEGRFKAMEELIEVVKKGSGKVESAKCACAYRIPENSGENLQCLYEQNADEVSAPMSVTKVLTMMVALDANLNSEQQVRIKPFDLAGTEGTSGNVFKLWEKTRLKDLYYAALFPSSNQAANAIARVVGNNMLNNPSEVR